MSGNRRGNDIDPGTMGCLVFFLIGIVAMPIVGIYLITKKDGDEGTKVAGWILLVVGLILWAYLGTSQGN